MSVEGGADRRCLLPVQAHASQHHYVEATQQMLMRAKALTDEPLDSIAPGRTGYVLAGDGQAQSRHAGAVIPREHRERLGAGPARLLEYPPVLARPQQPPAVVEALRGRGHG